MSKIFPSTHGAGAFIEMSEADWKALNMRAHVVVQDKEIASEITKVVPNYPALLTSSESWISTTFPGIVSHAIEVASFATKAANTLKELNGELKGVAPGDPVPQAVKFLIDVNYKALAQSASDIHGKIAPLEPLAKTFSTENAAADAVLEKKLSGFGPGWQSLIDPLGALDDALPKVATGWKSIGHDLSTIAGGTLTITVKGLLQAGLANAAETWCSLAAKAVAFDQFAGG